MPRRSPPPDRLAAEAALLPEELLALRTSAAAMGIRPDRWTQVPALERVWSTVAVTRLAAKLEEQNGLTEDRALGIAAARLGLCGETVRSRLKRFFQQSFQL